MHVDKRALLDGAFQTGREGGRRLARVRDERPAREQERKAVPRRHRFRAIVIRAASANPSGEASV